MSIRTIKGGTEVLLDFMVGMTSVVIGDVIHLDREAHSSRFSNILRGIMHNGFLVKVITQILVTYAVSLVFNHHGIDHGTYIPFKFKLDDREILFESALTLFKQDGWLMIQLCQFTSNEREHDYDIDFLPLFTITSSNIEYFLEGVEFRPDDYVS